MRRARGGWLALAALELLAGCQSPALVVPPTPGPSPETRVLFLEDFDAGNLDRFLISDPVGAPYAYERRDEFPPDGMGGALLERGIETGASEFLAVVLSSYAQAPVPALQDSRKLRLGARVSLQTPAGGDATVGVGVGFERLDQPSYALLLRALPGSLDMWLTRNDGVWELVQELPPVAATELGLELVCDADSGEVTAVVRSGDGLELGRLLFVDPVPLRPDQVFFLTQVFTAPQAVFRIDDLVVVEP